MAGVFGELLFNIARTCDGNLIRREKQKLTQIKKRKKNKMVLLPFARSKTLASVEGLTCSIDVILGASVGW